MFDHALSNNFHYGLKDEEITCDVHKLFQNPLHFHDMGLIAGAVVAALDGLAE